MKANVLIAMGEYRGGNEGRGQGEEARVGGRVDVLGEGREGFGYIDEAPEELVLALRAQGEGSGDNIRVRYGAEAQRWVKWVA